jgi:hypothetical protein
MSQLGSEVRGQLLLAQPGVGCEEVAPTVPDEGQSWLRAVITRLGSLKGDNARLFLLVLLTSAAIVVTARMLAPFEVGKDQAAQLEAAQRLADGLGLTTNNGAPPHSFDIAEPPNAMYLTQWPPGLSLIVAGPLMIGVPLLISLKIIYGTITLVGWLGWGIIASRFTSGQLKLWGRLLHAELVVAAILPIFVTPRWAGTDVFLWAGIPFVVLLLLRSASRKPLSGPLLGAGLLFGLLYCVRYTSFFLVIAAFFILLQTSYPHIKSSLNKLAVFLLSSGIVILPTVIYVKRFSHNNSVLTTFVNPAPVTPDVWSTISAMVEGSSVLSYLVFGSPVPYQIAYHSKSPALNSALGVASLLIILLLPLFLIRGRVVDTFKGDTALSLSFVMIALVIFLIGARLITQSHLFAVGRYYEPASLCGVLIFYGIVRSSRANWVARRVAGSVVVIFILYLGAFGPVLALIPERRDRLIQAVLSFTPSKSDRYPSTSLPIAFPSYRIYSQKEGSRKKIRELHDAYPDALFFVKETPFFIYDRFREGGPVPGTTIRDFPDRSFWRQAYTPKSVKVFWVLELNTKMDFVPEDKLKLVYYDPFEETKIFESDFPAGYRFIVSQDPRAS